MQNTLNPGETFTINRILKDHTDSTTYYVRAVVYDAVTRAVLATKDLTDNGSRWFSTTYKIPHDNVFQNGKRILIITSVYTDSGYTTKSQNHYDEPEEYLIQQRWNPSVNFGGGGAFDYRDLVNLLEPLIDKKLAPLLQIEPLEFPQFDYDYLTKHTEALCDAIHARFDGIKEPEKVDLIPVLERIAGVAEMLMERPKFEKTDLSSVQQLLEKTQAALEMLRADTVEVLEQIIVKLMEENRRLSRLTNSEGGTVKLSFDSGDEKKQRALSRIGAKYGVGV